MSRPGHSTPESALVVEDDDSLAAALVGALSVNPGLVTRASSIREVRLLLPEVRPTLLLLDVMLPDGTAFDVLEAARALDRFPTVIAISGAAGPEESFSLAAQGVRAFLRKPLQLATLERAIAEARSRPPDLTPHLRAMVGSRGVKEVEAQVRRVMVREALACSGGSRRGAARLLSVSRELLQHILRTFEGAP